MSGYTPYYSGGWQSGESGGTPITPAALNNMENGISAALTSVDVAGNLTNPSASTIPSTLAVSDINKRIADEIIGGDGTSYTKSFTLPAKTFVLVMARCNASTTTTIPKITITGSRQTAINSGVAGGSCFCYMIYATYDTDESITVTVENYTRGSEYNAYGRISVVAMNMY